MTPIEKITQAMNADMPEHMDTDELSVVTMAAHLQAVAIDAMPSLQDRRAAVSKLSPGIADMVKAELLQMFELRKNK